MNANSGRWEISLGGVAYQDAPTFMPSNKSTSEDTINVVDVKEPLEVKQRQLPKGVSVKITYLRPKYNHLKQWYETSGNVLVTRAGRVNYKVDETGETRVFGYKASPWANPFKVKEYSLDECLSRFQEHLRRLLEDPVVLTEFLKLADAKEIGCFCLPGDGCHRNVILKMLEEKLEEQCLEG
ncbi:hypothetical protein BCR33DRAFT_770150 [Rhizoclosmatium globosum]|uniref:DUF4326 domain-containing protein n=1 Tax=Rhizoclosmatium globosum TaxID=329046 RepID=A0A1Y2BPJ4_9FUNG|nr:hypothetical protein BCR33DRAFT_770150 [Rhizoclosmatium globosum]|eukprot:ORY36662.1 hypothetical protein BCR33DRAFT_770150 [Rhizoclosmatium globosum]